MILSHPFCAVKTLCWMVSVVPKLPSGKILKGKERELFETIKIKLDVLKSEKIIGLN